MFLGHIGVGLGLKRAAPSVNAGLLVAAALLLDVLLGMPMTEIVAAPGPRMLTASLMTSSPSPLSKRIAPFKPGAN